MSVGVVLVTGRRPRVVVHIDRPELTVAEAEELLEQLQQAVEGARGVVAERARQSIFEARR